MAATRLEKREAKLEGMFRELNKSENDARACGATLDAARLENKEGRTDAVAAVLASHGLAAGPARRRRVKVGDDLPRRGRRRRGGHGATCARVLRAPSMPDSARARAARRHRARKDPAPVASRSGTSPPRRRHGGLTAARRRAPDLDAAHGLRPRGPPALCRCVPPQDPDMAASRGCAATVPLPPWSRARGRRPIRRDAPFRGTEAVLLRSTAARRSARGSSRRVLVAAAAAWPNAAARSRRGAGRPARAEPAWTLPGEPSAQRDRDALVRRVGAGCRRSAHVADAVRALDEDHAAPRQLAAQLPDAVGGHPSPST